MLSERGYIIVRPPTCHGDTRFVSLCAVERGRRSGFNDRLVGFQLVRNLGVRMTCTNCGATLKNDDRFCSLCGSAMYSDSRGPAASQKHEEASSRANTPPPSNARRAGPAVIVIVGLMALMGTVLAGMWSTGFRVITGPAAARFAADWLRMQDQSLITVACPTRLLSSTGTLQCHLSSSSTGEDQGVVTIGLNGRGGLVVTRWARWDQNALITGGQAANRVATPNTV